MFVLLLLSILFSYFHFQIPILHAGKTPSKETVGATDESTLKCEPNFLVAHENCSLDVKEEELSDINETSSERIFVEDGLTGINVKHESLDCDLDTHFQPQNKYGDTQKKIFVEDNVNVIYIKHENLDNESDMQSVDETVNEDVLLEFLEEDSVDGTHVKHENKDNDSDNRTVLSEDTLPKFLTGESVNGTPDNTK